MIYDSLFITLWNMSRKSSISSLLSDSLDSVVLEGTEDH